MSKDSIQMWTRLWLIDKREPLTFVKLVLFHLRYNPHYRKEMKRIAKFSISAGLSVPVGLFVLWITTDIGGVHYLASNILAFIASTITWWLLQSTWTFRDMNTNASSLPKTLLIKLVILGINQLVLYSLTSLGLWYMFSAVIAILIGFPFSFYFSKKWIWHTKKLVKGGI